MNRRAFVGAGVLALTSGVSRLVFGQKSKAKRIYALIGDRYHNSDYIRVALTKIYGEMNVTIDYTTLYDKLSAAALKDYDAFFCLRDGMIWPEGYLGPDAYTSYSAGLENAKDFPAPKS